MQRLRQLVDETLGIEVDDAIRDYTRPIGRLSSYTHITPKTFDIPPEEAVKQARQVLEVFDQLFTFVRERREAMGKAAEDVEDEISKAKKFKDYLSALFLATTMEHDATLQEKVRLLSDQRLAQGEFAVSLLFWDEIVGSLLLNPEVFKGHYPQIHLPKSQMADKERPLAALEFGYYGGDIWAYITLLS